MRLKYLTLALLLLPTSVFAQSQRNPCYYPSASPGSSSGCIPVSTTNPLPVTASGGGGPTTVVGTTSNGSDTQASTATNIPAVSYLYGYNGATWDRLQTEAATVGVLKTAGSIPSGSTDLGNPVKIGMIYNSAVPSFTNGQRADAQGDANGNLRIRATGSSVTGADAVANTSISSFILGNEVGTSTSNRPLSTVSMGFNGSTWDRWRTIAGAVAAGTGTQAVAIAPTSSSAGGITSTVTGAAANNLVLKASAGNMYSVYATNLTATAGFLVVLNATSAPADGAITPLECVPLPANGNATVNYASGPPAVFSTGITAVVTSATTCFTKTTGTITAFIGGRAS